MGDTAEAAAVEGKDIEVAGDGVEGGDGDAPLGPGPEFLKQLCKFLKDHNLAVVAGNKVHVSSLNPKDLLTEKNIPQKPAPVDLGSLTAKSGTKRPLDDKSAGPARKMDKKQDRPHRDSYTNLGQMSIIVNRVFRRMSETGARWGPACAYAMASKNKVQHAVRLLIFVREFKHKAPEQWAALFNPDKGEGESSLTSKDVDKYAIALGVDGMRIMNNRAMLLAMERCWPNTTEDERNKQLTLWMLNNNRMGDCEPEFIVDPERTKRLECFPVLPKTPPSASSSSSTDAAPAAADAPADGAPPAPVAGDAPSEDREEA